MQKRPSGKGYQIKQKPLIVEKIGIVKIFKVSEVKYD